MLVRVDCLIADNSGVGQKCNINTEFFYTGDTMNKFILPECNSKK